MKEIIIGKSEEGQRLDKFLKRYLANASSGFIYKMLRKKNIVLNRKKAEGNELLSEKDSIMLFFADETLEKLSAKTKGFVSTESVMTEKKAENAAFDFEKSIIYEDENLILVNKPSGILTQKGSENDISLCEYLLSYLFETGRATNESLKLYKPSAVNRLDRNTSGIVICALTYEAARSLSLLLKDRSLKKEYVTLVKGRISESLRLSGYLLKDEKTNTVKLFDKKQNGLERIETNARPLYFDEKRGGTWMLVDLISGKTHQIRAHLAGIGHPVAGDFKYGDPVFNRRLGLKNQLLHAVRLSFPVLENTVSYVSGRTFVCEPPLIFKENGYHGIL